MKQLAYQKANKEKIDWDGDDENVPQEVIKRYSD